MHNITDPLFAGCPEIEMYISWIVPDAYKNPRKQPVLENWPAEDLEAYCGIYQQGV